MVLGPDQSKCLLHSCHYLRSHYLINPLLLQKILVAFQWRQRGAAIPLTCRHWVSKDPIPNLAVHYSLLHKDHHQDHQE